MKDFTKITQSGADSAVQYDAGLRSYMIGVYKNMGLALAISGFLAFFAGNPSSPFFETYANTVYTNPILFWIIALAPLGMVLLLNFRIHKMSYASAKMTFWGFSVLMGLSLSTIMTAYTDASIFKMFFVTAATFAAMSLYGYTTKRDLTGMGSFLMMGLIGIIIASVVNIFLQSSALEFVVSILGVFIFIGLTAYDTQKIKNTYFQLAGQGEILKKAALMGALSLYLDFINLMIMLLRLFGERR